MKKYLTAFFLLIPSVAYAHGMSVADKQKFLVADFGEFIWLGAKHMITGYDHLLFLFGVIFFLTKFKDILKFVTAFTLGHSITLIAATYLGIKANYYLIDAVIALTVIYKGFDNVNGFRRFLQVEPPNLLKIVFCFGLIHGFGLSTRLQQLPLGDKSDLLWKIIAFNVGVEAGQIAALVVLVGILSLWRAKESFQKFSMAANTGLIVIGAMLFLMQLHGYGHIKYPDEFGFSQDAHVHHHEYLNEQV